MDAFELMIGFVYLLQATGVAWRVGFAMAL